MGIVGVSRLMRNSVVFTATGVGMYTMTVFVNTCLITAVN